MVTELNKKEIGIISGGIIGEIIMHSMLCGIYSHFKMWLNDGCANWEKNKNHKWSSKEECETINVTFDAVYYGTILTLIGAYFHQIGIARHQHVN